MRPCLWLAAATLALAFAPALAAAQAEPQPEACRPPLLTMEQPRGPFEPGSSTNLLMSIENPNTHPVESVRATVTTTAPAGWSAIPAQRELTLGPQKVSISTLAITAPNRGSGAGSGNVTLLVSFVCSSGEIQTSASSTEIFQVSLRAFEAPWPLVLGAFGLLAGGVTVLGLRRLRRGTALVASAAEREIAPGRSVKFTFSIENRRGKPQRHKLLAEGIPEGWTLHFALKEVELEPGEEKAMWAILKAPPLAAPGTRVAITLRLVDERDTEAATGTLHARVNGT